MGEAGKNVFVLLIMILLLLGVASSASISTSPAAKIISGFFSNTVSIFLKRLWSLKPTAKTEISGRPLMKFESGYNVETVFDGSKLGVEPYSVDVLPGGELLILDSVNSNIYRISSSLSLYSRPKLVAGSPEGSSGHVDGRHREAKMNHPKGLTVDDRGNIYIADTANMAIRKISDSGVTTIAGGKWGRGGSHVDGASEDAKFSNDFDVVYVRSSCSLLVIDRGNRAIREIQLHFDDCAYLYESSFPLGIAVLVAAASFGYVLALMRHRLGTIVSPQNDRDATRTNISGRSYQKLNNKLVRPPLIPTEEEMEKHEESFFGSLGKLFANAGASVVEIFGGIFPGLRKKPLNYEYQSQQQKHSSSWPEQDSFVIPDEDEPPSIETRTPTPRKTYPFMSKDAEKMHQWKQGLAFYGGGDDDLQQHQQQQKQKHGHHHRYQSSIPHTYYKQSQEQTNEIVFGAVQEQDSKREPAVIKPVNHGDSIYNHHNIRSRTNSTGYASGY